MTATPKLAHPAPADQQPDMTAINHETADFNDAFLCDGPFDLPCLRCKINDCAPGQMCCATCLPEVTS
jgi:hypothetical protein